MEEDVFRFLPTTAANDRLPTQSFERNHELNRMKASASALLAEASLGPDS
jgi:hypothetical protein